MKTTIAALFLLCATAVFSQSVASATPQPLRMDGHPEYASQHAMAHETSLFGSSTYAYAKGEVPLADLGSPIYHVPLGDLARDARREHVNDRKAVKVFED